MEYGRYDLSDLTNASLSKKNKQALHTGHLLLYLLMVICKPDLNAITALFW